MLTRVTPLFTISLRRASRIRVVTTPPRVHTRNVAAGPQVYDESVVRHIDPSEAIVLLKKYQDHHRDLRNEDKIGLEMATGK